MKLSELEALVAGLRKAAVTPDPTVEFYNEDERCPANLTVAARLAPEMLHRCRVDQDGSAAARGDFAIPLTSC